MGLPGGEERGEVNIRGFFGDKQQIDSKSEGMEGYDLLRESEEQIWKGQKSKPFQKQGPMEVSCGALPAGIYGIHIPQRAWLNGPLGLGA